MEKVTGRTDDMIILRGVNLFPTQLEEILLGAPGLAPHFQFVLTRRGRMDAMTVQVEARPDCLPERRLAVARGVVTAVKSRIGVTVTVEVVDPDTLERSLGKLQRVVDQRR
jgi:phenylacetate-CoA ligase